LQSWLSFFTEQLAAIFAYGAVTHALNLHAVWLLRRQRNGRELEIREFESEALQAVQVFYDAHQTVDGLTAAAY